MSNRKLLLPTYYFPPCGAVAVHRMLGLAKYLPHFGWDPIIVAPPAARFEVEDPSLLKRVPPETTVVRVPFPKGFVPKLRERIEPMSSWLPPALAACQEAIRVHRPDAILTSGPPHCLHRLGMTLQRQTQLPWAVDLRDPWYSNLAESGKHRFPWGQLASIREAKVFARADLLIAVTPIMRNGIAEAYPDFADKAIVALNGFDPDAFPPTEHRPSPDRITLVYAGEFYAGRDPRPLLDALAEHRRKPIAGLPPIHMNFYGRNTQDAFDLEEEICRRNLADRVRNLGLVTYRESLDAVRGADILVLLQTPNYRLGAPAKLYEYLGSRRPILALAEPDSDIDWVLQASGIGHRIASPTNGPGIRSALFDLAKALANDELPTPRDKQLNRFSREGMASSIAAGLDWMLAGGKLESFATAGATP